MATDQPLTSFVVWAPYHTDPGAPERRLAVRPIHLDRIHQLTKDGIVRAGGPVLTPDSANAAPADRRFYGSCLILVTESLEAARKVVEGDIYYTSGVWDKEKLLVLPIVLGTPLPPLHS